MKATEAQNIIIKKIKTAFIHNDKADFTHNLIFLLYEITNWNDRELVLNELYEKLKED